MKPHHGNIISLSSAECVQILNKGRFAHLGCQAKGEIYIVPITYAFDDGYIYSHSKPGKKINIMKENPNICIQVEEVQDFFHWKSVLAWGKFEELKDHESAMGMRLLIQKVVAKEERRHTSDLEMDFSAQLERAIIYRMKIDRCTGRSEGY